jgi:D-ribose pyranose/furanose isomerase RbsD
VRFRVIERRTEKADSWASNLNELLPTLGHRNWIVIADAAYPAQSNPGIETIATGAQHLDVLRTALQALGNGKHVKARIYLDAEFKFVSEHDAPGVTIYRQELARLIGDQDTETIPHEEIIDKLDQSARLFRILILKSNLAIPYTTVFVELDCKYWNRGAEKRLRLSMAKSKHRRSTQKQELKGAN